MSYRLLAETRPVARKEHRCIWCGEKILKGETYRREKSVYDGHMQDFKWHTECDAAATEYWQSGGDCEFGAHEQERGEQPS